MKTCPECGELLGDSVEFCFKCFYHFKLKRKITKDEREKEQQKKAETELQKAELERQKENKKSIQLSKNPYFEYQVVIVNNLDTGEINQNQLQTALNTYAENGWKLHSIFNNELGKTSSSVAIGFLGSTVNATIDQTVLIFERCIKASTE